MQDYKCCTVPHVCRTSLPVAIRANPLPQQLGLLRVDAVIDTFGRHFFSAVSKRAKLRQWLYWRPQSTSIIDRPATDKTFTVILR